MTRAERNNYRLLDASRKTRVAGGSGSTIGEVNQLLRQYEQMRKMMAQMNRGGLLGGLGRRMAGGLAGGLGGMLGGGMNGLGGMYGNGSADADVEAGDSISKRIKKKKRHKTRR
jgi:signal recognition particle subunit SRP54